MAAEMRTPFFYFHAYYKRSQNVLACLQITLFVWESNRPAIVGNPRGPEARRDDDPV